MTTFGLTGDSELLESDKRSSDTWRCELGIVHGDKHRKSSYTETSNESTS